MNSYTEGEIEEALRPIFSLISKSEKAQLKLKPGTWQYTMLKDNLKALHYASKLMSRDKNSISYFTQDDLKEALRSLASMIEKTGNTRTKFLPGTSHHTLQRNRLNALHIAEALIKVELNKY